MQPLKYIREVAPPTMPKWLIAAALPFCMALAFVETLAKETKNAWWYAGNHAMQELDAAKRAWRDSSATSRDT